MPPPGLTNWAPLLLFLGLSSNSCGDNIHPPGEWGAWVQGHRLGSWGGWAAPSGASWQGVGGPVRAPGDPGRLLAAPALAAAQGVCGNDTARAAEIPPPDIGWKVEQLVRDNQWRSIAKRRRRTAWGRGGGAGGGGGIRTEVKQHTALLRGTAALRGHTDTQSVQGNITKGHWHHKGGTLTTCELHHTSLATAGSNKWFGWTCTIVSQTHNHQRVSHTIVPPVHPATTGPPTTTTYDPILDTHNITRTQNESYIPLAGLKPGNSRELHILAAQQTHTTKQKSHTAKLYVFTTTSKNIVKLGVILCNNPYWQHNGIKSPSTLTRPHTTTSGTSANKA